MPMEDLCVLTIHNTRDIDGGKWVCHITSKSNENEKNIINNTGIKTRRGGCPRTGEGLRLMGM